MDSPGNTRQTLLQKLQMRQDEKSWEEFVHNYEGYIYVCIRNLTIPKKDREDLLQDVLVKIWKAMPNYSYERDKCKFRSWLSVVVRNTVYDFCKSKKTRQSNNEVSYETIIKNLEMSSEAEVDKISEYEWQLYVSNLAWKNLENDFPEYAKKLFEASLKEDDNKVLAERFGIADSSVRVYKMRIKKALKKEIVRLHAELGG